MVGEPEFYPASAAPERDNERDVSWTVPDALLGAVLLFPLTFALAAPIYGLFYLYTVLFGTRLPLFAPMVSLGSATFIAAFGLAVFLGPIKRQASIRSLGFTDIKALDIPLAVLGEAVIFTGLAIYSTLLTKLTGLRVPSQPVVQAFGRSTPGLILAILFVVILAPVSEEVFFRGFLYSAIRRRWGIGWGLVISSAVFALFHLAGLYFIPMFIIGLTLASLFEYRRSLAPNILLHALNNFLALMAAYYGR